MFAQIQKNETIFIWEREITSKPHLILSLSLFFFVGVASSSCLTPAKVILGLFYILTHDCILQLSLHMFACYMLCLFA